MLALIMELHTRQMIERLTASLNPEDSYLLDMQGVQQISRSAADEPGRRRVRVTFAPNHKNMEPDDELHVFFL